MKGVEFRLGHTDHLAVEDFLAERPAGVSGIVVDAKNLRRQAEVIAAAREAGVDVHVEPLTDRLVVDGYTLEGLNYGQQAIDPQRLLRDTVAQRRLVDAVTSPQIDAGVSHLTPPHFYVETLEELDLNLELTRLAIEQFALPVRPIVAAKQQLLADDGVAHQVARAYRCLGVNNVDLRLSPLGSEAEGPVKIAAAIQILQVFRQENLDILLGSQGSVGETALAMGLVEGFSVGIGYREHYNHREAIRRQLEVKKAREQAGRKTRGPVAGVRLPNGQLTVSRDIASQIYNNRGLRLRLRCGIGKCAERIDGPIQDPRGHYLHSRAHDAGQVLKQPEPWRPMMQRDRLVLALDLRKTLNEHLPETPIKTRTLESLLGQLDAYMEAVA